MQQVAPCVAVNLHQDFSLLTTRYIDDIFAATFVQWNRCRSSITTENPYIIDMDVEWMMPATTAHNQMPSFRCVCLCGKQRARWIPEAAVDLPAAITAIELDSARDDNVADIRWFNDL